MGDQFERSHAALLEARDSIRLARLYIDAVDRISERADQLAFLRRGVDLLEQLPSGPEQAVRLRHQIVRLDPTDAAAFSELEQLHTLEGEHSLLADLLEAVLNRQPPPPEKQATDFRARLVELYRGPLGDAEAAVPHLVALLEQGNESALAAGEALLEHRSVASRIAPALASAYQKLGRGSDELAVLTRELRIAVAPRMTEVQRRLAALRLEVLDDSQGALALLEPLIAKDPGDSEARQQYVSLSQKLGRELDAARLLARSLRYAKDDEARAAISLDVGELFLKAPDPVRARASLEQVLELGPRSQAALPAARHLLRLGKDSGTESPSPAVLEVIARLDPDRDQRLRAATSLLEQGKSSPLSDSQAISAWRVLLDSKRADEALQQLEALCRKTGDRDGMADVLERKAARAGDRETARELAYKATELRAGALSDAEQAISAWQRYLAAYGPARPAYAAMGKIHRRTKNWKGLYGVLEQDLRLAPTEERGPIAVQLGDVLIELGQFQRALQSFRESLGVDPAGTLARKGLERLLGQPAIALEVAAILEPLYRAEGNRAALSRIAQMRADTSADPKARLQALAEALDLLGDTSEEARYGQKLCARGLEEAFRADPAQVASWIERLDQLQTKNPDPEGYARILVDALGDRPIDSPELSSLALRAVQALSQISKYAEAQALCERALSFDPTSAELFASLDSVLALQGVSVAERIARHETSLAAAATPEERAKLLFALGALQRNALQDLDSAVATWQRAIQEHPSHWDAHRALIDAYRARGDTAALHAELERALGQFDGLQRRAVLAVLGDIHSETGESDLALEYYRQALEGPDVDPRLLERVEALAESRGDSELVRRVLEWRVTKADDPGERAEALEKLGNFQSEQLGDQESAINSWTAAARISERVTGYESQALNLYERVLNAVPTDTQSAEQLLKLYAHAGDWSRISEVAGALLRPAQGPPRVDILLALEPKAIETGAITQFTALADEVLWNLGPEAGSAQVLLRAKARVLASGPETLKEAADVYHNLIESYADAADVEALEGLLDKMPSARLRSTQLRWLFNWKASRGSDPVPIFMQWAQAELEQFSDPEAAKRVYQRALSRDPTYLPALREVARLDLESGDLEGALGALQGIFAHASEPERQSVALQMAKLLVDLERAGEALELIAPMLQGWPVDQGALNIARTALRFPDARARATTLLENAASVLDSPQEAGEILAELVRSCAGDPELREQRHRWSSRLIELRRDDPEAALEAASLAAEQFPESEELWRSAQNLAQQLGRPQAILNAYLRALDQTLPFEIADRIARRAVEYCEEWFNDPAASVPLVQRVLEVVPGARWALDRVKLTLSSQRRFAELFDLYDGAIKSSRDDAARADLLDEAALAAKDLADDPARAIGYLEQLRQHRPREARIESALERLYERQGRTRELIQLLTERAGSLSALELSRTRARIGKLWLEIGGADHALEVGQLLLADGSAPAAGIELLEKVMALPGDGDNRTTTAQPELLPQLRAAALLREHYAANGRAADVVRTLKRGLDFPSPPEQRAEELGRIVSLELEELGDTKGAFDSLCQLVLVEPESSAHREKLAELAASLGANAEVHQRRAETLTAAADLTENGAIAAELLLEAAGIFRERLGDPSRAAELYPRALQRHGDGAIALQVCRELDALLLSLGRSAERPDVLVRLAALEPEAAARRRALAQAARLTFEALKDADRSIGLWRAVLAEDPDSLAALQGLTAVLRASGRWEDLIQVLEHQSRLIPDAEEARRRRAAAARIYAERLNDFEGAIGVWQSIREQYGPDRESFEALSELFSARGEWPELVRLLSQEAGATSDAQERARLYQQLGDVHRQHTGDVDAALDAYGEAGDWERARALIADFEGDAERTAAATESLIKASLHFWRHREPTRDAPANTAIWAVDRRGEQLVALGDARRAVKLMLRTARLPFESRQKRALQREAAFISADSVGDTELALAIFRELFAEDSRDDAARASVERFATVLESAGLDLERAELMEQQAQVRSALGDATGARSFWETAGGLWETKIVDLDRATAAHRYAASLGAEGSLGALARIYRQRGDLQKAASALERLCVRLSGLARIECVVSLAETHLELGDAVKARACLDELLLKNPQVLALGRRLVELYRRAEAWGPLSDLLSAQAERSNDARQRAALMREIAEIRSSKLSELESAVTLLEQAIELVPDDASLRAALGEALNLAGRHQDAARLIRREIDQERRPRERALLHLRLGKVLKSAGSGGEAYEQFSLAGELNPGHPEILLELAQAALLHGDLERSEQTYRTLLLALHHPSEVGENTPSRAEIYLDLSEVAARRGDASRAGELVESAFEAALNDERDALRLERSLRERGKLDLLLRAVESRLEHAPTPSAAAAALDELTAVYVDAGNPDQQLAERMRSSADVLWNQASASGDFGVAGWLQLAHACVRMGDEASRRRALEICERVLEQVPSERGSWQELMEIGQALGQESELIHLAEQAISRLEDVESRSWVRLQAAKILAAQPDQRSAVERLLRKVLDEDPLADEAAALLSPMLAAQGRTDELLTMLSNKLERALQAGDAAQAVEASTGLGTLLERSGRPLEALEVYERCLELDPTQPDVLSRAVRVAEAAEVETDRLAGLMERLLPVEPPARAADLSLRVSKLRAKQGDPAAALRALEIGLSFDPQNRELRTDLMRYYDELGEWTKLSHLLRQALDAQPDDRELLARLVLAYRNGGQHRAALEVLDNALAVSPSDQWLYYQRSLVHQAAEQHDEALADLEQSHALSGEHADELASALSSAIARAQPAQGGVLTLRLADLLKAQGRTAEARERLQSFLQSSPEHIPALSKLASLAVADQDWGASIAAHRRLLALEQGDALVLAALNLADACERSGEPAAAREDLERVLAAEPGRPELWACLEKIHEQAGAPLELAKVLIRKAQAIEDPSAAAWLRRAGELLLEHGGNRAEAVTVLERAHALGPEDIAAARQLSRLLRQAGNTAGALGVLELTAASRQGQRSRELSELHREMAGNYLASDDLFNAFDALLAALESDKSNVEACTLLGLVALDLDQIQVANRAFLAITMAPGGDEAAGLETKSFAYYQLGRLAREAGDVTKARMLVNKAVSANPENQEARTLLHELKVAERE